MDISNQHFIRKLITAISEPDCAPSLQQPRFIASSTRLWVSLHSTQATKSNIIAQILCCKVLHLYCSGQNTSINNYLRCEPPYRGCSSECSQYMFYAVRRNLMITPVNHTFFYTEMRIKNKTSIIFKDVARVTARHLKSWQDTGPYS